MCVAVGELEMYIFDNLAPSELAAITFHLGECGICQGKLVDSVKSASKIRALARTADAGRGPGRFSPIAKDMVASVRTLDPASSGRTQARVLDTSLNGVTLRVTEFLGPGSTIQIRMKDSVAFGEVRYCQPAGSAFNAGIRVKDTLPAPPAGSLESKRKEPRNAVVAAASLRIEGKDGLYQVMILDVSRSGLRIRSQRVISPGARVHVIYRAAIISGETRYARELAPDEFNMGIIADGLTKGGRTLGDLDLTSLFNINKPGKWQFEENMHAALYDGN